jgi:hypothetical protein
VIDSVRIDTAGNNLFVKDVRSYKVYASDTNGIVGKIYVSWNNGSTADDSMTVSSGYGVITHAYDTAMSGSRTIRFWAKDDDTLTSDTLKDPVVVRLAAPVLWGDNLTKDTIWTIINNGYGINYNAHINSYDTNGTIVQYYWSDAGSFDVNTATKTNDSIYSRFIGINDVNNGFPIWIYGRDNDSLTRGGKFVVFADSVPPAPQVSHIAGTDSITIYWSGKDAKDGDSTQYRILLKEGSEPDSTDTADILSDWKRGYEIDTDMGYDYKYKFKLTTSSPKQKYYYQVYARDARGSVTVCTPGHNFSF